MTGSVTKDLAISAFSLLCWNYLHGFREVVAYYHAPTAGIFVSCFVGVRCGCQKILVEIRICETGIKFALSQKFAIKKMEPGVRDEL